MKAIIMEKRQWTGREQYLERVDLVLVSSLPTVGMVSSILQPLGGSALFLSALSKNSVSSGTEATPHRSTSRIRIKIAVKSAATVNPL